MVSLLKPIAKESGLAGEATLNPPTARLSTRVWAYLVDSVALFAFILLFFILGGLELLIADQRSAGDPPDSAYYAFFAIFLGGSLLAWSAFTIGLMAWRAQTTGMLFAGLRLRDDRGERPGVSRLIRRWLALNPLLFHPLLLPVWALIAVIAVSVTLSDVLLVVTIALTLLCVVSPLVALVSSAIDSDRRALHDRMSGTLVCYVERP